MPVRLLCFPPAGMRASTFESWSPYLPRWIELVPAELPRDADRHIGWPGAVGAVLDVVEPFLAGRYAFYGHSFGARLAYELALRRRAEGARLPEHLFVASCRCPHRPQRRPLMHALPDRELLRALEPLGAPMPPQLGPRAMSAMLGPLRRDLRLAETWHHDRPVALGTRVTALYGCDDPVEDPASMAGWSDTSTRESELVRLDAGHSFVDSHAREVCDIVAERLAA